MYGPREPAGLGGEPSLRRRLDERWAGGSSNPRSWVVLLSSVTGGSGAPMASVLVEPLSPQVI